jgi:hypothetical protein
MDIKNKRELLSLLGVASPSLLILGRFRLDRVGFHFRAPAKPSELGVYKGSGACDLLRAQESRIPSSGGGICRGVHIILWAGIWCSITPVSLLSTTSLWPGTASLNPLRDLAHDDLCNPV